MFEKPALDVYGASELAHKTDYKMEKPCNDTWTPTTKYMGII